MTSEVLGKDTHNSVTLAVSLQPSFRPCLVAPAVRGKLPLYSCAFVLPPLEVFVVFREEEAVSNEARAQLLVLPESELSPPSQLPVGARLLAFWHAWMTCGARTLGGGSVEGWVSDAFSLLRLFRLHLLSSLLTSLNQFGSWYFRRRFPLF